MSTAPDLQTLNVRDALVIPDLPKPASRHVWGGLVGDGLGWAVHAAAAKSQELTLVITPDMRTAESLQAELAFFGAGDEALPILGFPDWETLPYDLFSPHQDIISQRLRTLYELPRTHRGVLVVPVTTLMQRLAPRSFIEAYSLMVKPGDVLPPDVTHQRLEQAGYRRVSQVMEHGEFAVRGSLVDLFPMGSALPYRIDLFDEEVESIRTFDPETQRSLTQVERIELLPAREIPMDDAAITRFRQAFRAAFEGDPQKSTIYRDVSQGLAPNGIEYYLPLFFETTASLFDYLPAHTPVFTLPDVAAAIDSFRTQAAERFEERRYDRERPLLPPTELFLQADDLDARLNARPCIDLSRVELPAAATGIHNFAFTALPDVSFKARAERPAGALLDFLTQYTGRVLIAAESAGRREMLLEQLRDAGLELNPADDWHTFVHGTARLSIVIAPLEQGLKLVSPPLALIPEAKLFVERARQTRARRPSRDPDAIIRDLTDLNLGAPVVHENHGVGRYLGLQRLAAGGIEAEFLTLEYAGGDKLYVPVSSLQLVSRYTGADPEHAPLHKLGGEQWQRAKRRAAERVRDVAAELLAIYAQRAARPGTAFNTRDDEYAAFAAAFPFEETPDQQQTIENVLNDLAAARSMDRVVCGDVGFGKTEVAMRAAFVAAQNGHQVAILVPTTLLAQQHYQNFSDRFADWPIRIEVLSRFRDKKSQEAVMAELVAGTVDIVIGTHKLLQGDVRFKRLGLVILDEEHRFGVRQKEQLKKLRAEVDVLTLTATPIPRTMNMSLAGLRDLSIIATPPAQRLAVKTFVGEWHTPTIREACLRELKRGGQVYFLHNDIDSIERIARELHTLMPEAAIAIAHGQMRERDLEQVMLDFYHRRSNILVCTTIIESGIDVPSANTIIINRADRLGLAQLHQLRGRVGRSHHRAYAYLIAPPRAAMSADAVKRLEAVESLEELGSGFTLATHDLEIRGAGELLGEEQSGQIHEIGFSLYTELLERTVRALREGREPNLDQPLDHGPEIDLHLPALIPDDYLPDVHARLILYKRIANAADADALRELQVEMIDRFGLLPAPTRTLFQITELKLLAQPMGIRKIDAGDRSGRVFFHPQPVIDPLRVIELIQTQPRRFQLDGADKLRFHADMEDPPARMAAVRECLQLLNSEIAA